MVTSMGVVIVGVYCEENVMFVGGKRKLRNLFWKVRAEIRRQFLMSKKKNQNNKKKRQQQLHRFTTFQYDPLSYALNFDNGNFGFFC